MLYRNAGMHGDPLGTYTTGDMGAAVAELKERGVDVDEEIRDTPWGRFAMFRDLDGDALQHQRVETDA